MTQNPRNKHNVLVFMNCEALGLQTTMCFVMGVALAEMADAPADKQRGVACGASTCCGVGGVAIMVSGFTSPVVTGTIVRSELPVHCSFDGFHLSPHPAVGVPYSQVEGLNTGSKKPQGLLEGATTFRCTAFQPGSTSKVREKCGSSNSCPRFHQQKAPNR